MARRNIDVDVTNEKDFGENARKSCEELKIDRLGN